MLARERARAEFQDWEKKEEEVDILSLLELCGLLTNDLVSSSSDVRMLADDVCFAVSLRTK